MSAQPGWYPDQQAPGQLRYWNGQQWTEWRAPAPPPLRSPAPSGSPITMRPAPAPTPSQPASWPQRHPIATSVLSVLILLFVVSAFAAIASGDPDGTAAADETSSTDGSDAPSARPEPTDSSEEDAAVDETPTSDPTPSAEPRPTTVAAPVLVGQHARRARSALRASDLRAAVRRVVSPRKPGTVLRQSARAGKQLAPGSTVTLVVSAPWPRVPDVRGTSAGTALSRLQRAGFRVTMFEKRVTSGRDTVVLTQASPGRTRRPESTIQMVVADLHKPAPVRTRPAGGGCTPGYSPCLKPMSDYDCAGGSGDGPGYASGPVTITGSDPYGLDRDGDGIACEY